MNRPTGARFLYTAAMFFTFLNPIGCIQERVLFPRDMAPAPLAAPPIPSTIEWTRDGSFGARGVAWYIPALDASPDKPRPCVVFFHGNAEIIDYQSPLVRHYLALGCAALLPEYPGYGRAKGMPTQTSVMDDAEYFYQRLLERPEIDQHRLIFHGRSLGGAVAAQLAASHEPAALILQSTFTSVPDIAKRYLIPGFLVRHPFHTDEVVAHLECPMLIFHGAHDRIIPVDHARKLRDLAAKSRDVRYVEYNCDHNDFPGRSNEGEDWRRIAQFLRKHRIIADPQSEGVGTR
ncbi:MAG TPA: alpha/beta hydrolase [Phycisphaerae bacterium]|nr:alpha/beta hydrolase [Phycisphaerae bacterium]HRW55680.1 alpha/beta hydrolase [Phycisphaerae bacterium]